jgi:predicted nucleotidyltransferase
MPRSARVQQVLEATATFTTAERAELVEELAKPIVFTEADMERQRKAILEFLAIPTVRGTGRGVARDKYSLLT